MLRVVGQAAEAALALGCDEELLLFLADVFLALEALTVDFLLVEGLKIAVRSPFLVMLLVIPTIRVCII